MNKINILVAYPYMKENVIEVLEQNQDKIQFVLDSGAFTAWKAGKPIKLDDYCSFIEKLPFKPWRYFNLDVIGDGEKSFKNYETMLSRGLTPIPIFTRGEDVSMIDEYYKTSDVLGIGGLVGTKGNKGFVKGIMQKIGNRKVHWLGFTDSNMLSIYKPYMCDCSSWSYVSRYGYMLVYKFNGMFESIYRKEFVVRPNDDLIKNIKRLGFDYRELANEESWRGDFCLSKKINAKGYLVKSLDAQRLFKTNMFIACGARSDIEILLQVSKGLI